MRWVVPFGQDKHLGQVVDVALRVDAAREGQAHQFVGRRLLAAVRLAAEHDAIDRHRSHATFQVQHQGQRPGRVLVPGNVGQQALASR